MACCSRMVETYVASLIVNVFFDSSQQPNSGEQLATQTAPSEPPKDP